MQRPSGRRHWRVWIWVFLVIVMSSSSAVLDYLSGKLTTTEALELYGPGKRLYDRSQQRSRPPGQWLNVYAEQYYASHPGVVTSTARVDVTSASVGNPHARSLPCGVSCGFSSAATCGVASSAQHVARSSGPLESQTSEDAATGTVRTVVSLSTAASVCARSQATTEHHREAYIPPPPGLSLPHSTTAADKRIVNLARHAVSAIDDSDASVDSECPSLVDDDSDVEAVDADGMFGDDELLEATTYETITPSTAKTFHIHPLSHWERRTDDILRELPGNTTQQQGASSSVRSSLRVGDRCSVFYAGMYFRYAVYNPMTLVRGRQHEVESGLRHYFAVSLCGTGLVSTRAHDVEWKSSQYFLHISAGRAPRGNPALGVSICLHERFFAVKNVVSVHTDTTPLLKGRVLAVRVAQGRADYTFFAIYFPHSGVKNANSIIDKICKWLDKILSKLPVRTMPVLGMDLNDDFGCSVQNGVRTRYNNAFIGEYANVVHKYAAECLYVVMRKHRLAVCNSFFFRKTLNPRFSGQMAVLA